MSSSTLNEAPVRKRGRPPKNKVVVVNKKGIVDKPDNPNSVMELQYNIPTIFKKIFSLFEKIKIHDLKIEFRHKCIFIKTIDSIEKNSILLTINCNEMIQYYLKFEFEINVDSNILQKLLKKIDGKYVDICFYSTEECYNNELNILLFRNDVDMKEKHIIKLIDINSMEDSINNIKFSNEYLKYPIQFQFTSQFFKKVINDMNTINDEFTIEKKYNGPLTFKYKNSHCKLICKNIFKSNEAIKLICTQEPGDIYGSSLYTSQIKPISSNLLFNNINIFLKQDKDITFEINIEKNTFIFLINSKIKTIL